MALNIAFTFALFNAIPVLVYSASLTHNKFVHQLYVTGSVPFPDLTVSASVSVPVVPVPVLESVPVVPVPVLVSVPVVPVSVLVPVPAVSSVPVPVLVLPSFPSAGVVVPVSSSSTSAGSVVIGTSSSDPSTSVSVLGVDMTIGNDVSIPLSLVLELDPVLVDPLSLLPLSSQPAENGNRQIAANTNNITLLIFFLLKSVYCYC
jgi:hypothetical protein